ncbi:hypothetical protein N7493_008008 [Penicillium malachiteum]|uniref:Uncharacterized protein n=1 Tax=Penicillium malachiteum TaxID=1324776 RepID=A0AAD6MTG7_9EURO|nr:hypothetical protein N7493_008008 [Penicillium malachiteum]
MEKPWGEDDWKSDTTSLASEIARGRVENGRRCEYTKIIFINLNDIKSPDRSNRYQSFKSEEYW